MDKRDYISVLNYEPQMIEDVNYQQVQKELKTGWNTWYNNSMLTQVLLPEGFSLHLGLKDRRLFGDYVREFFPMDNEIPEVIVRPGKVRTLDGSYTDVEIEWKGIKFRVESATENEQLYWLITPTELPKIRPHIAMEAAMLWQYPGKISIQGEKIIAQLGDKTIEVHSTATPVKDLIVPAFTPTLTYKMDYDPIGFCTGEALTVEQIANVIKRKRKEFEDDNMKYGHLAESYQAMAALLGWSTIYEPMYDRVVTPGAGRWWNKRFNSYVVWGWDFTAFNYLPFDKNLTYANIVEIIRHITPEGFFPNYAMGYGTASRDRSQPPVYGFAVKAIYEKYGEKWFLEVCMPLVLKNNRWWHNTRQLEGYLCWGSSPILMDWDAHTKQAATFESGLDNSPMFDDVPFNTDNHLLMQGDVGLMALYVYDCESLAYVAAELGQKEVEKELLERAKLYKAKLATMWDEEKGIYLNFRLDIHESNPRISPTNFYPMLINLPTKEQADRLVNEHLLNPVEFWGEYVIPSISRNDPGYPDQAYWRGRVWPPMNMLVYMGLKNYGFEALRKKLAEKTTALMLKDYRRGNWIRENYHAELGDGTFDSTTFGGSDCYYTWGTLMGIPEFMENRYY